jgi:PTS system nitrogen regulatory IIA component
MITNLDSMENGDHTQRMYLLDLLKPELMLIKADSESKDALIAEIAEKIYETHEDIPLAKEELLKAIDIREKIGGTTLPSGLSIPHSRMKDYDGIVIALGTTAKPIFNDGIQIRLMTLMLSSQTGGLYYLPAVAAFTKISRDEDYFSRLCGAENPDAFISILNERNPDLG